MHYLFIISSGLTGFFLLLLITRKNKRGHDRILVAWFTLLLINLVVFVAEGEVGLNPFSEFSSSIVFLHGPALWFYATALSTGSTPKRPWLHLLPFCLYFIVAFPWMLKGELIPLSILQRWILTGLKLVSMTAYMLRIRLLFRQHESSVKATQGHTDKSAQWLRFVTSSSIFLIVVGVVSQILRAFEVELFLEHDDIMLNVGLAVMVVAMGYYGFRETTVFVPLDDGYVTKAQYSKSLLAPELARAYYTRAIDSLAGKRLYRNPELTLDMLASDVGVSANNLSQAINSRGRNFFDLVNGYRIQEVCERLRRGEQKQQTLESIALQCGFASKASFNRIFKKTTGTTPSRYTRSNTQNIHLLPDT